MQRQISQERIVQPWRFTGRKILAEATDDMPTKVTISGQKEGVY